ncbi:TerB family tellurite resistance protein [Helicobacter sp. 11S02596-1]|uniref:TerB family tellurite resistance protein n=1 Tax=Helicobacter sp. 11S02596-1 TaxID=1476194 RepID=UPI000BA5609E|nr:TerB family tellurite resistance protein [Helicobacter sp. 11S02596-1]PAF42488.1 hypothetical protein BJI48_06730 [Helicobacter sp. 11S02596-1]
MDIVLLILAGVVVYYLYITLQEYLKNPISVQFRDTKPEMEEYDLSQDPYVQTSPLDKIKKTEFGILTAIIAKTLKSTKEPTIRRLMVEGMFEDMASQMQGVENPIESLRMIGDDENLGDLDQLCKDFLALSYGEYKKRLKLVEFLFALAYVGGKLDGDEKENIIDVAAFLELGNEDFNRIYDAFEAQNETKIQMDRPKALEIFGLGEDFSSQDLEGKFKDLVLGAKQNIFDIKNLNKSFVTQSFEKLREIELAYELLCVQNDLNGGNLDRNDLDGNDLGEKDKSI